MKFMFQKLTEAQVSNLITSEHAGHKAITNPTMQNVVKTCIENTMALNEDQAVATNTGNMSQFTPVVISLLRRTLPSLIGPEIIGTQAMKLPTGRIFVQRVYGLPQGDPTQKREMWGQGDVGNTVPDPRLSAGYRLDGKADASTDPWGKQAWSTGKKVVLDNGRVVYDEGTEGSPKYTEIDPEEYTTAHGENLAFPNQFGDVDPSQGVWPEMTFGIDFIDVNTKTRALKGRISTEVMEDLKSVHNVDAESELSNILEAEIVAEIDREIVGRIYYEAEKGAQNCKTAGTFSFADDTTGRWTAERVLDLMIQIEREATTIAQRTRRGRGNFIITSPEIASLLSMNNLLTPWVQDPKFTPVVNPLGTSFVGTLANRFKVYVDPYMVGNANQHMLIVGYKGNSEADSGLIYCPYLPIQMYSQIGEEDFGKRIGIKSRYGLVSNPWMCKLKSETDGVRTYSTRAEADSNMYYRKFTVDLTSSN